MTVVPVGSTEILELQDLGQEARNYLAASRSEATQRSYETGWRQFTSWAAAHGLSSLPASPEVVALYLTDLTKRVKPATIDARLAAISAAHRADGYESPTKSEPVRLVRRGVRRTVGTAQRQVRPVSVPDLRKMVDDLSDDLRGRRDRALLLLGFAGALRRSELVGLDVADVAEGLDGLTLTIRRSKTDPEGAGRVVGIPRGAHDETNPVRAWKEWLGASGITEGAAFRPIDRHGHLGSARLSAQSVAAVVKRQAERTGIGPEQVAGHSLRAGLATSAAAAGVSERSIAATTGHKGTVMLRKYIREGSLFRDNAAGAVGL